MKSSYILSLATLTALSAAAPQPTPETTPTWTTSPTIAFAIFNIAGCAAQGQKHIESHESIENGKCISLEWARSIAYNAAFNHTHCDTKFFSDGACSPDKEIAAPTPFSNTLIDDYYPGCWDDVSGLNTWGGKYQDDLVPSVNLTITCA